MRGDLRLNKTEVVGVSLGRHHGFTRGLESPRTQAPHGSPAGLKGRSGRATHSSTEDRLHSPTGSHGAGIRNSFPSWCPALDPPPFFSLPGWSSPPALGSPTVRRRQHHGKRSN